MIMRPLDLVNLTPLMERTFGIAEIKIALIDGPVAMDNPDLAVENIRAVSGKLVSACSRTDSLACMHGTLVAGVLCAKRGSAAPAICPGCTLLVRPIFAEMPSSHGEMPNATPRELASAIIEAVDAGARILNMSAAPAQPLIRGERDVVEEALNYAARRGVIAVAAAGNHGAVGSSAITRHPWVIPVTARDLQGRPMSESNLGGSIGRRGLSAPGENITSIGADGRPVMFGGTSAAAPFVTGAIALLWSKFPSASAAQVKFALVELGAQRRRGIVPPLLDAWAAYLAMPHDGRSVL